MNVLRFKYSYDNTRVVGGPRPPNAYLHFHLWEWCFKNLRRPATVYFYSSSSKFGDFWFIDKAQVYRRLTKKMSPMNSWAGHLTIDGVEQNQEFVCFMEMSFEDHLDRELFLYAWLGRVSLVTRDEIPYKTRWNIDDTEFVW